MQLLYFGSSGKDWSAHIRRDLGISATSPLSCPNPFSDRGSLLSYLEERELQHRIHRLDEYPQLLPALITAVEKAPNGELTSVCVNVMCCAWANGANAAGSRRRAQGLSQCRDPAARERRVRFCINKASMNVVGLSWRTCSSTTAQRSNLQSTIWTPGQGYQPP